VLGLCSTTLYSAPLDELITDYYPDIFLLQEHWLTPGNIFKLDKFTENFTFGCSAMPKTVESSILRGRHFGGVNILITGSPAGLSRVNGVRLTSAET